MSFVRVLKTWGDDNSRLARRQSRDMNTPAPFSPHLQTLLNGVSALPHLGVIQAQGEDAANFLHNQLSNDVLLLPVGQSRLAAFCSAKGRMQASFVLVKTAPDTVLLVLSLDLLAQTLKRLSMFVLRAKVKMTDATGQWQLRGLLGDSAKALVGDAAPWQTSEMAGAHAVALYPAVVGEAYVPRALWLAPQDHTLPNGTDVPSDVWPWAEVMSGVTLVSQPVFEAFVPQMLNYESVDGVNFKKGCYPGQEVVARSQFRGTLKRRAYVVQSAGAISAGQEIFTSEAKDQPCGLVAQVATVNDQTYAVVELQTNVVDENKLLHVGTTAGPQLDVLPLPYVLKDDI